MPDRSARPTQPPTCPYLGLAGDPATWCAFPAPENHCHRPAQPQPVALSWQADYCLTPAHTGCPVTGHGDRLPDDVGLSSPPDRRAWLVAVVIAAMLLVSVVLSVLVLRAL